MRFPEISYGAAQQQPINAKVLIMRTEKAYQFKMYCPRGLN